jgi:hypothetical protein
MKRRGAKFIRIAWVKYPRQEAVIVALKLFFSI